MSPFMKTIRPAHFGSVLAFAVAATFFTAPGANHALADDAGLNAGPSKVRVLMAQRMAKLYMTKQGHLKSIQAKKVLIPRLQRQHRARALNS